MTAQLPHPEETGRVGPQVLRRAFGHFPTGVCIVAGLQPSGEPFGLTVSSFQALSLDPALVSFSVQRGAASLSFMSERKSFAVNILRQGQGWIARQFAERRPDRFANVPWSAGRLGNPLVSDALAYFECELWSTYDGGDHVIVVGRIGDLSADIDGHPLIYLKGGFLPPVAPSPSNGLS